MAEEPKKTTTAKPAAVASGADADKLEIFVKSLSFDVDEKMLADIFGKYGNMTKCKLV